MFTAAASNTTLKSVVLLAVTNTVTRHQATKTVLRLSRKLMALLWREFHKLGTVAESM